MGDTHSRANIRQLAGQSLTIDFNTGSFASLKATSGAITTLRATTLTSNSLTATIVNLGASSTIRATNAFVASAALSAVPTACKMIRFADLSAPATPAYYYIKARTR